MQGDVVPIIGNRLEYVGSFRIYLNKHGELVIPVGNCRVYVEDGQARAFLEDLLSLAGRFRTGQANNGHALVSSNGRV